MMGTELIIAALLLGLAGAPHCAGMCGGIANALTFSLPDKEQQGVRLVYWQALFAVGRILSYSLMGVLVGIVGQQLIGLLPEQRWFASVIAASMLFLIAFQMAGLWRLSWLETAGHRIWRHIQPVTQKLIPVNTPLKALLIGMLWGWIPCGLVYSALALAASSTSPVIAGAVMFAFGLSTTPAVISTALVISSGLVKIQQKYKNIAAAIMAILGLLVLWSAMGMHGQHSAHQHHATPSATATPAPEGEHAHPPGPHGEHSAHH